MEDKNPLFAVYSYKRKSIRETIWIAFIDTIKFNLVYTIRYITVRKVKRKWERIYIPYIYIWNYKAYIVETYDFYFCARYRRLRDITPVSFLEYGFLSGRNSSFLPATRLTDRNQPISNQILERAIEDNNWNKPSVLINLTFYPGSGLNSLDPRNRTRGEANFSPTPVKLKFISMDELCSHLLRFAPFLSSPPRGMETRKWIKMKCGLLVVQLLEATRGTAPRKNSWPLARDSPKIRFYRELE